MYTPRQQEIIEQAIKIISKDGFQELTIRNLSQAIGVTEGAIYKHFKSKFEILEGLLIFFKNNSKKLIREIEKADIDPFTKIERFYQGQLRNLQENPTYITALFSENIFIGKKKLSKHTSEIMKLNSKAIRKIIDEAKLNNQIKTDLSTEHIAMIIMGVMRLNVKNWIHSGFKFKLTEKGKEVFETIKKLIQP